MLKTSIDSSRRALNGQTMGARWSALFYADADLDTAPIQAALQAAVDEIDGQMSTWTPHSELMRFNAAPVGAWVALPSQLMQVLWLSLEIGRASGGAFDIGLGDAVAAWGFGPEAAQADRIRAALAVPRRRAHEALELDRAAGRARKTATLALDLNGIAKGHGVDRLAETLVTFGIASFLVGIDGEMRARGVKPDGAAWSVAVEAPDHEGRAPHSVLLLHDAAVATSGDYRHWIEAQGRRFSHTMDPTRGAPLSAPPASVTVVAPSCAEADAWATALMVLGAEKGTKLAQLRRLDTLFLLRNADGTLRTKPVGPLFTSGPVSVSAPAYPR